MEWALNRTVDPTVEPVSLAEAKLHCRVDIDDDDGYLETLVVAARENIENLIKRQCINATWVLGLSSIPSTIVCPRPPLSSVTSITYLDTDGVRQTLSTDVYDAHIEDEPGVIALKDGQSWPSIRSERNSVEVTYVAGYGAAATSVPASLKHAIKLLVGHWYVNREQVITGTIIQQFPFAVEALLAGYINTWETVG